MVRHTWKVLDYFSSRQPIVIYSLMRKSNSFGQPRRVNILFVSSSHLLHLQSRYRLKVDLYLNANYFAISIPKGEVDVVGAFGSKDRYFIAST